MINDYPKDLKYTPSHIWVKTEVRGNKKFAWVGITEELANRLREILSIDMPMVGDELEMDAPCIHIHRPTSIYEMNSPLSGRATTINKDVLDTPRLIALAPYKHWFFCMEYDDDEELDLLLSAHQYAAHLDNL